MSWSLTSYHCGVVLRSADRGNLLLGGSRKLVRILEADYPVDRKVTHIDENQHRRHVVLHGKHASDDYRSNQHALPEHSRHTRTTGRLDGERADDRDDEHLDQCVVRVTRSEVLHERNDDEARAVEEEDPGQISLHILLRLSTFTVEQEKFHEKGESSGEHDRHRQVVNEGPSGKCEASRTILIEPVLHIHQGLVALAVEHVGSQTETNEVVNHQQEFAKVPDILAVSGEEDHVVDDMGHQGAEDPIGQVDQGEEEPGGELRQNHDVLPVLLALHVAEMDDGPNTVTQHEEHDESEESIHPRNLCTKSQEDEPCENLFTQKRDHDDLELLLGSGGCEQIRVRVLALHPVAPPNDRHDEQNDHGEDQYHRCCDRRSHAHERIMRSYRLHIVQMGEDPCDIRESVGADRVGEQQSPRTEHGPDAILLLPVLLTNRL